MSSANPNQHLQEHDNPTFDLSWDYGYDGELRVAPQTSVTPVGEIELKGTFVLETIS